MKNSPSRKTGTGIREAQADRTRKCLVETAMVTFAEEGYEGASIDKIARRACCNKQLIYHYFGSKEALFREAIQEAYLRFRGDEQSIVAACSDEDPVRAVHGLANFLYGRAAELNIFQRLLYIINMKEGQHLDALVGVKEAYARLVEIVGDILARGAKQGLFREGIDPAEFYVSLTAICATRISSARTLSYALGMDLLSNEGARQSRETGIDMLISGITRK